MNTVLVTGASGFIGRHLISSLSESNQEYSIYAALRPSKGEQSALNNKINVHPIVDIESHTEWKKVLVKCSIVVHLAACVHENVDFSLDEYRRINVIGTLNLARQAAEQGVKRFIFISSIKVNGSETPKGYIYSADDMPNPKDFYAVSKYEAEQGLLALAAETGMQVVIIRPPLVYGMGVKGNFLRMIQSLEKSYPLPFKCVKNKRSFVSVYNLVDLIILCMHHPKAVNQVFLVSDGEDLSTPMLLKKIAGFMQQPAKLLPVPVWLLSCVATIFGKRSMMQRLCGSLQVDMSKTYQLLNWKPRFSVDEGLLRTAEMLREATK